MNDNNNSSGFSLDRLRNGVSKRSSELSEDARARSLDGSDAGDFKPFEFEQEDYDRIEAPKDDMRKYWRQFETTPIVRKPITSFASRVTESGYYIESRELDEEEIQKIGNWLDQCAIIEGKPGKDFRLITRKAIIQREVRGTALVEKAPDKNDEDKIAGLKLINPETMEAVTRPNQNILLAPDDLDEYESAPEAESGGAAAWLQDILETGEMYWGTPVSQDRQENSGGDTKIGFQRDEIIPLTRDADVGEVFGTSRIEAVSDRIDGIKQKLEDNDEAIQSKAYPLWLFLFGSEENPWDGDKINKFMGAHEMENFHPGMKQGVRGDVGVETISGEVADIAEYLQFDMRWIMSVMPMPMFVLGAFEGSTAGQVAGIAQQQDVNRQIREARRELEEEFTPLIREVAIQQGIDEEAAKDIKLKIGKPGDQDLTLKRNESVIRYVSGAQGGETERQEGIPEGESGGEQPDAEPGPEPGGPTPNEPVAGVDNDGNPFSDTRTVGSSEQEAGLWDIDPRNFEELADGDDVGADSKSKISDITSQVFRKTRDEVLGTLSDKYETTPQYAAVEYENIANRELNRAVREANLRQQSREVLADEITEVAEQYGDSENAFTRAQNASFFAQSVENAVRDAAEEMLRRTRVLVRNGVVSGESWSDVRARVEDQYGDVELQNRANLIAHMELKSAVESTKLQEFEAADDVVGVRVHNPDASARITESLHGAEAFFDDGEVDNQLAEQADEGALRRGFDPLPRVPPYHFGDTTTLEPIYTDT